MKDAPKTPWQTPELTTLDVSKTLSGPFDFPFESFDAPSPDVPVGSPQAS